jgi:hypothetical protein
LSSSKIHHFSSLFPSLLSLTLIHHSSSSPLLLPLIPFLFLHLPPYSHPLTPSTHRHQHPSIIPPNSLLPTHILIYSSPFTLITIIRSPSLSSTFLAIYPIFTIFDQLVFPCPPERCLLQKYTTFHPFFTLTHPLPFSITIYLSFFYYLLFFTSSYTFPPYSHPLTPSTYCYQPLSIIPPNSVSPYSHPHPFFSHHSH